MTDKQLYRFYGEARNYADPDAFASDAALSLLDPDNPSQEVDMEAFEQLRTLWHVVNDPFKALLERMELTQTECSTRFCIPLRTVQGWALEERSCPPYVRLMMSELGGVVRLRND